ncbi:hypothetical protein [[Limnothrix rosea] IAM M-220]|uniref:hypothetical protein n=1 Tax=[Limnothrix rosea] IAM M-220 TaxID=454133 RepID=UPI000968A768|nr:hypothetical protein [[Limnothrix rosea] IAM M-220]OKH18777.1 hypothetical protein NIES208_04790 [[Limnothrix rosea] IAM M-220]
MDQLIINLILLFFILVFVGAVWLLWLELSRQQRRKKGAIVLLNQPKRRSSNRGQDSALRKQLIRLLHGDRQAVERLIYSAQLKQPGKSEGWYEEKVLQDLERDRR